MATQQMRPRVAEALRVWDSLPTDERNYAAVAERMNITTGRAAVYTREALNATDRISESPQRGTRSAPVTAQTPEALMQAEVAKLRRTIDAEEAKVAKAKEAASSFDAEAFRQAEQQRRVEAVKEAQARAKAWKEDTDGVASTATSEAEKALSEAAKRAEAEAEQTTAALRATLESYEKAIAALA